MIEQIELAWAAGFFDGEGNTYCFVGPGRRVLRSSVAQNGREALDRFQKAVGGIGKIYDPYDHKELQYTFIVQTVSEVIEVMEKLFPHLCSVKREQYIGAVDKYYNEWVPAQPATHCKRGHEFTEDNIYVSPKKGPGSRECKMCRAERGRNRRRGRAD